MDNKSVMKAMLSKYGNKFRKPVGEQFVAGTIDLDAMRKEFAAAALACARSCSTTGASVSRDMNSAVTRAGFRRT
jgi:hypothetical protein